MYGDFFLLERKNQPTVRAERLAFGETSGRNEAWLRDTLLKNPELLPVNELDPAFGPLIPLCTELRTEAGPIDIAYINAHGRLTLVECKLWRNPEARRKVIAQVLDYARAVSNWSYSDLQRQVSAATGRKGNVPYEIAKELNPELTEHQFIDSTVTAMSSGKFLLLIAGDGIREDVGSMAELINRNAASGFSFGLVEVALYGMADGALIAQPRMIAKTQIIERTVVVVTTPDGSQLMTHNDEPASESESSSRLPADSAKQAEFRDWWAPVVAMSFDDPDQEQPKLYWPNNVRSPLPFPKTWLLAYRVGGENGKIGISTSGNFDQSVSLFSYLKSEQNQILSELPKGTEAVLSEAGETVRFETIRPATDFKSENAKREWIMKTLNTYANVFRPRAKRIST